MGNMQCPAEDVAHLASVARDICPFPNYNPSPHFINMLSINSSHNLGNHYTAVQASLTPTQLEDFTRGLRTAVGKEGKVTLGGVGVVALSLAVLFDTLASQARGEWVPESGPIPGLFIKTLTGNYPPYVYTVSEYLRLVPYIANNPTRMREEAERYFRQLLIDGQNTEKAYKDDDEAITGANIILGQYFERSLRVHLLRIANSTEVDEIVKSVSPPQTSSGNATPNESNTETGVNATFVRKRRIPATEKSIDFHLNCDAEAANKVFLAVLQTSDNRTQEAFKSCQPLYGRKHKTWLHFIAGLVWMEAINHPILKFGNEDAIAHQREDFDLKANALGKWEERFTGQLSK